MKLYTRVWYLAAVAVLLLSSCAKEETESFDRFENQALEAWMHQHRPELVKNYQSDGGYYVDVLEAGDMNAAPISDTVCWVSFDFSGRDLSGNIILTRSAAEAHQVGSFTKYTHYVPYYRYCGESYAMSSGQIEGHLPGHAQHPCIWTPTYAAGAAWIRRSGFARVRRWCSTCLRVSWVRAVSRATAATRARTTTTRPSSSMRSAPSSLR